MSARNEDEIDNILEALEGAFRLGKYYLIKTVTYHYVGSVHSVGHLGDSYYVVLENVVQIMQAGDANNATVLIITGKAAPKQYEEYPPDRKLRLWVHSFTDDQMLDGPINLRG